MIMKKTRWWAAGALALSMLVIGIDGTVLSLALPTLATDLGASTSQLQWFVDAYLLALAAFMLPAGMLGDRYGRKRMLLGALVVFAAGSLACAYAGSSAQLVAARVLLGLGAAFMMPLALAVLPVLFDEGERQRAIAVVASAAVAAYPLGPIVGGWLLTHYWWGSVFLINVPIIALALLAVTLLVPESRGTAAARLDWLGTLLSAVGLAAFTYGVIEAGARGWGDSRAVWGMAGGALVLLGFVMWQRRTSAPLVDLSLFRSASFSWGTVLATLVSFAMIGMIFLLPQYLTAVLGHDSMGAGLRLLPMIGGLVVGLGAGDRISRAAGPKWAVVIGFVVAAGGLGLGALTEVSDGTGFIAAWLAIAGAGIGVALPPTMNAALSQLSGERSGVGSGVITAIRQVGGSFGVAVLGSQLNSAYRGGLNLADVPEPVASAIRDNIAIGVAAAHRLGSEDLLAMVRSAFVHGMDVVLATTGGVALGAALLAVLFLPGRVRAKAAPATPTSVGQPTQMRG
jgi:EmrB/QacA subfamily drug resistance transporter